MRKRKERNRQPGNISGVRGPFGPARIFNGGRRIAARSRGCAAGAGSLQCKIYQAIPYISEVRGQKSYREGCPCTAKLSHRPHADTHLPAKTREGSGATAKGRARQSLEKSPQTGGAQDERDGRHCWPGERHVEGRKIRHLRIFTRHDIRMVRFLSLRGAG